MAIVDFEQQRLDFNDTPEQSFLIALSKLLFGTEGFADELVSLHLANLHTTLMETMVGVSEGRLAALDQRMLPLREIDVLAMGAYSFRRGGVFLANYMAQYDGGDVWSDIYEYATYNWSIYMLDPRVQVNDIRLISIEARNLAAEDLFTYNVGFVTEREIRGLIRKITPQRYGLQA